MKKIVFCSVFGLLCGFSNSVNAGPHVQIYGKGGRIWHPNGSVQVCPEQSGKKCAKIPITGITPMVGDAISLEMESGEIENYLIMAIDGLPDENGDYQGNQLLFTPND